jgi:signal transduction histidine kinase
VKEALRAVPLFADLTDADLEALAEGTTEIGLAANELLFSEGDQGDHAYVITGGEVEIFKTTGQKEMLLAVRGEGTVIGEMALLDAGERTASIRARSDVTMLTIGKDRLDYLLETSTTALRSLFQLMLVRWRENESRLRQSERMAQLGTLTAGLAHELNNPAAAVRRGADQLRESLVDYERKLAALPAAGVDAANDGRAAAFLTGERAEREPLDALARSDLEEELEDHLDALGVDEPWKLVPELVEAGISGAEVDEIRADFGDDASVAMLHAVAAANSAFSLLYEVEEGASRLSSIVGALKSYSYLDQAPVQEIDVTRGLDDTLLILKSKLKDIEIRREYDESVPSIHAYGSELNQVWTNLIDNAADALNEAEIADPSITLRTSTDGGMVIVEVEDNGPGVPEDIQQRIFDAFFTTKPPGSGTGLGLDISYSIVVNKHRGDLVVDSEPGRTVFRATLPVEHED